MEKQIKDYLHLYLGCECKMMGQDDENKTFKLTGISYDDTQNVWWAYFAGTEESYAIIDDVFPILRKLDSMTEEEWIEAEMLEGPLGTWSYNAESIRYLLSKGFDLFDLLPSNLAIDKNK